MSRIALLLFAASLTACSGGNPSGAGSDDTGRIEVQAQTFAHFVDPGATSSICATFEFQAYSLDSAGKPTLVGAPFSITTPADGSPADTIVDCTDGQASDTLGDNWGFEVSATDFVDCTTQAPIPDLSPSTVIGSYPVDCRAGLLQVQTVAVDVSIPAPNYGGYLDLAVGVALTSGTAPLGGLCGDYTVQPLQVDSQGNTTEAGSPVTVASNFTGVDTILGCVVGLGSPNWELVVTPGSFYDCASNAPVQATAAPLTMTLDCVAAVDILAAGILQVSIP